jgi:hypothetical protein
VFRNVGIYNSDAGELHRTKHKNTEDGESFKSRTVLICMQSSEFSESYESNLTQLRLFLLLCYVPAVHLTLSEAHVSLLCHTNFVSFSFFHISLISLADFVQSAI